ncbi:hypothetical protein cypCar_00044418 [Cyprinus carpio]|nr:hypothetical protein cypCar_00044418 [Cyprinus carpio]
MSISISEKIKDLLPQGSIDSMTRLCVLVNAIYFKGNWEKKLPKEATRDGQFKLNKVLELPYVGKNLSMLIILLNEIPDETTGLQKVMILLNSVEELTACVIDEYLLLFKLLLFVIVKMEHLSAANTQFFLNLFKKISGGDASGNVFYSPISISSALAMVSLGAKENTAAQMFFKFVKMERLSAANTRFSLNLFKKINVENSSKNVFYSPISISSALAMVTLGAKGNTAAQMFQVLSFTNPPTHFGTPVPNVSIDQIHSSFNKLMSELNKPGAPYVLSIANRLYGEQSYQFVEKFLNDAKRYYQAGLEEVDFKKKSEAARVNINKWVERKTQEKIKDLLPPQSVSESTRLVLVNAIYFKGNWEKKFPKEATRDGQFKLNKTQTKPVKMMNQKSKFPLAFIPEMNSQVLELPYVGKNLSMLIILPNEIQDETTGLQKLEMALTYEKLMEWTRPEIMHQQEVEVSLPRFKMEETYDMKSLLISMGMEDVFDEQKVNLLGMSPNNDLVLTKVIHKAFVEVNEEGTEAAGATGISLDGITSVMPVDLKTFIADHPFLFFIRHNPSNNILFFGHFCSP